jgi:hypothetical protein
VAIDPPWRLDPLKKIVGVGWGGGNVLVLRIETRVNNHTPRLTTIEDLQFTGSLIDAYAETINEHDDHLPPPDIINPMDGDMRAHTFMWNRPPYKVDAAGDESAHTWKAIVFLNLSRIRSFLDTSDPDYVFMVHFPASEHDPESGFVYYAFWNFGELNWEIANEVTLLIPVFFTEEMRDNNTPVVSSNIQAFGTAFERDFFITLQPDIWDAHEEPVSPDPNDGLNWRMGGRTYRKRINFPTDAEIAPLWNESTAIGAAEEHAESVINTPIPAYVVTVTVNLDTLEISMTKA